MCILEVIWYLGKESVPVAIKVRWEFGKVTELRCCFPLEKVEGKMPRVNGSGLKLILLFCLCV